MALRKTRRNEVEVRPKWKKPAVETPLLLSECRGVRDLNDYLKTKGVDTGTGTPSRITFEWHKSLEGRSGRGGQAHLSQICAGVQEFYSELMAGLRSVDILPAEIRRDTAKSHFDQGLQQQGSEITQSKVMPDDHDSDGKRDETEIPPASNSASGGP